MCIATHDVGVHPCWVNLIRGTFLLNTSKKKIDMHGRNGNYNIPGLTIAKEGVRHTTQHLQCAHT